jgi:hypothetical protein
MADNKPKLTTIEIMRDHTGVKGKSRKRGEKLNVGDGGDISQESAIYLCAIRKARPVFAKK